MRILLDECVDQRLRRELVGHDVSTTQEMGWAGKKNGELLGLAENSFRVFITVDRNLYFQQNLTKFNIAVVVLSAKTNKLVDLRSLVPQILEHLAKVKGNEIVVLQPR